MKNLMSCTALASGLLCNFAFAQSDTQTASPATRDVITVTALRREQSPQDVSVALTVLGGDELIALGVDTLNGLENVSPSLEIESQFGGDQPSYSIRGVGFRDYATLNAPTVGIYVDDVAFPVPVMTQGVLFDVDRVEILRGPQGTLYGRNTTGGAIKVISARPTDEFRAGLVVEGGRFGRVDTEGFISGPVSETVRIRLSGASANGGAWQTNRETGEKIGDAEKYALRGLIEVDLSDTIEALINIHGFVDDSDGLGLQLFNPSVFGAPAHAGRRETSFGSSDEFATLAGFDAGQRPFRNNEGWGASLTLNAALGDVDVAYIGSFETLNRKEFNDWDALTIGAAGVFFQSSVDVMSHELRFSGDAANRLRWVGGLYYADEDLNEVYQSDFVASFGPGFAVTTPYKQDVRTLAAYLHTDFDVTDIITIVAGVRYEGEARRLRDLGTFATGFGALNFANGTVDGTLENRDLNSDNVSGKIGVNIKPAKDILLYASYSRGIKSGGFTAYNTLNPNALDPFTPEKLNAYEAGFKTQFADGAVTMNGAVFYYDYKDQQVQSAIFDAGTGAIVGRIVNAPESEIYGAELELTYRPSPWLTIGQSLGYKSGEFKTFTDLDTAATAAAATAVSIDRAGQDLGFPNLGYQGFIAAQMPVAQTWRLGGRIDYSYRGELALPLLGPAYLVEDYWLANAQLTFGPRDDRWEIALWGRNIFNADYDETRNFFIAPGGVADVAAPGLPATYGARLSVSY
jgi:iron complex outermembrane recepter protein